MKNQGGSSLRFTIRSLHRLLFFIGRPDLESVWGCGEVGSSFFIITNPSPSPIPWCSPSGVSNSFVGSLVGEGVRWDSSCNLVSFVRAWSLVSTLFWDWCWYDFAMLNACHFRPRCHNFKSEPFMLSPLYPCSRSDLASYSHLLHVMIRQPRSDNSGDHSRQWP